MTNLYIVSTQYHLLISIVKIILANRIGKDIIIFMYRDQVSSIAIKNASFVFKEVLCFNRFNVLANLICYKLKLHKIPLLSYFIKKKNKFNPKWFQEKEIFIFNDNSYMGCYLNIHKIKYNLIEDGLNFFKINPFNYVQNNKLYKLFGLDWEYLSKSKYTKSIEVNDTHHLWLKSDKIRELNREEMFRKLNPKDIDFIANIFNYKPIRLSNSNRKTLLLTQPLDKGIMSHDRKIKLYKHLVKQYAVGTLYIKMHPREKENYSKIFPDAIILGNNTIPFEIFQLKEKLRFNRAITTFSKVIDSISCADEKIFMGEEWTMNFK